MSSEIAINLTGLGKCYQIYDTPRDRLLQMLMRGRRRFYREFWALQGISLEIKHGEAVGIVGRNGAGKSTLLQMICGTLNPTDGIIDVNGRVSALLELGAGFNPEFSGRENVFLSAAIMGVSKEEVHARYDEIVNFSGIGDFIEQPVRTYSSGMYVRLAFAVATSVDPDILIVDEALSVGDGEFSRKSFDRIAALKELGTTILFCSHSMYQVEAFCDRVLWLDHGRCIMSGAPREVISRYKQFLHDGYLPEEGVRGEAALAVEASTAPVTANQGHFTSVATVMDGVKGKKFTGSSGASDLVVRLEFYVDPALPPPVLGVNIRYANQVAISSAVSRTDRVLIERDAQGFGCAELTYPKLALRKGEYQVSVYLACEKAVHFYDYAENIAVFEMTDSHPEPGLVVLPHSWSLSAPGSPGTLCDRTSDEALR